MYTLYQIFDSHESLKKWIEHIPHLQSRSEALGAEPPRSLLLYFSSLRDSRITLPYSRNSIETIFEHVEGYTQDMFVTELNAISSMLTSEELEMCIRVQLALPK